MAAALFFNKVGQPFTGGWDLFEFTQAVAFIRIYADAATLIEYSFEDDGVAPEKAGECPASGNTGWIDMRAVNPKRMRMKCAGNINYRLCTIPA